jgi:hypothetical protein
MDHVSAASGEECCVRCSLGRKPRGLTHANGARSWARGVEKWRAPAPAAANSTVAALTASAGHVAMWSGQWGRTTDYRGTWLDGHQEVADLWLCMMMHGRSHNEHRRRASIACSRRRLRPRLVDAGGAHPAGLDAGAHPGAWKQAHAATPAHAAAIGAASRAATAPPFDWPAGTPERKWGGVNRPCHSCSGAG